MGHMPCKLVDDQENQRTCIANGQSYRVNLKKKGMRYIKMTAERVNITNTLNANELN